MMTRICLYLSAMLIASVGIAMPPIGMELDRDAFLLSDLDPNAEILYYSVSRVTEGYIPRNSVRHQLITADPNGEARIDLTESIPRKFVAMAVELQSGRLAIWSPEGGPAREIPFPVTGIRMGNNNRLSLFEERNRYLELLLIRPGSGVWTLSAIDGNESDESPASDGAVTASVTAMRPLIESMAHPEELLKDDILIQVSPRNMNYSAMRIDR